MSWLQLELETHQAQAEELSDLLEQFGALSVSLTASSDEPIFDLLDQGLADHHKEKNNFGIKLD